MCVERLFKHTVTHGDFIIRTTEDFSRWDISSRRRNSKLTPYGTAVDPIVLDLQRCVTGIEGFS